MDESTRLLLLGSLPGEESLARQRYYANPRNQFWRLTGAIIDTDLVALEYQERLDTLLRHGIGLWDVVQSAERRGSLDAAIRGHQANPLAELAAKLPELRAVGFNGGTSARIGMKEIGSPLGLSLVPLPSSSPAYTLPFEKKRDAWLRLRRFL